ncbi:hypothetical protein E4U42_002955 [Claviceps africana]|uniref:Uncharacterized protein n=1 Tax=Claviceps africana TaxID=83212 RepID=A0A8K0J8R7_9HYPO|nr:hypothetical protein E4U42_002955 [Claviceps africana]
MHPFLLPAALLLGLPATCVLMLEIVVYYVNFIHSLNKTRRNFPKLAKPLSADEQQQTCSYFDYLYNRWQTRLPLGLASNCYTSGIKGSWCNYLVICLPAYAPILADVQAKVIGTLPQCTAQLQARVATIDVYQRQAEARIEAGRYYKAIPWTLPPEDCTVVEPCVKENA